MMNGTKMFINALVFNKQQDFLLFDANHCVNNIV